MFLFFFFLQKAVSENTETLAVKLIQHFHQHGSELCGYFPRLGELYLWRIWWTILWGSMRVLTCGFPIWIQWFLLESNAGLHFQGSLASSELVSFIIIIFTFQQINYVTITVKPCLCLKLSEAVIFQQWFVAVLEGRESHIRIHLRGKLCYSAIVGCNNVVYFTYICQPSKHYVMVDTPNNVGEQIAGTFCLTYEGEHYHGWRFSSILTIHTRIHT